MSQLFSENCPKCPKITSAECKCHDFLPSFLHRQPFGVQKRLPTKWRTKLARRPFGVFLASFWRTKKAAWPFAVLFWVLDAKKSPKGQQKVAQPFFVLQFGQQPKKDSKKSLRSFWLAKGRHGEKDGKKSWHLRSPFLTSYYYIDPKVVDPRSTRVNLVCSIELAHIAFCLSR